ADAFPFLHDLLAFRETPSLFGREALLFKPVDKQIHGDRDLIQAIREDVLNRASTLQEVIKDVGETLATAANLQVAANQVRLGARLFWLTIIIAVLTLWM